MPRAKTTRAAALLLTALTAAPLWAEEPTRPRANGLAGETSPYLLQHAHNPVNWLPWGPEALAQAKREDKPIFLSIGYSSCYWCHVMERESFENEAIARTLNERFICVKVDREERPDVDQIYMNALQAMTGGGGWPLSMFLTPDGRPFYGGTYYPPEDRDGMIAFPAILKGVHDAWTDDRERVERSATQLADLVRRGSRRAELSPRVPLSREILIAGQQALAEQYDREFGGFGFDPENPDRPKFPEVANILFLLDQARLAPANPVARRVEADPRLKGTDPLAMALGSLDHMARGGIRDHLGGGYHRYSVNRFWTVPHFEKMLYDNAQLAIAFLQAFEDTGDPRWRREAEDILAFVRRDLTALEGGFQSTIDAETEGEEGAFYVWKLDEVRGILGDEASLFERVHGLDREPNFEDDRFVLQRPRDAGSEAATLGLDPEVLESRLAPLRARMLEARGLRPRPRLDDKILTAWNGLMIAAYADGFRLTRNEDYRREAERAADFVLTTLRKPDGSLLRSYRAGQAKIPGYLEDYAFLAYGLLRLHAATGDAGRLDQARALVDRVLTDFADEKEGGFYFTADDHESLIDRPKEPYDNAVPSGNSVMIDVLLSLADATGERSYRDSAVKALDAFSSTMGRVPASMPWMLMGLSRYLAGETEREAAGRAAAQPTIDDPLGVSSKQVVRGRAELAEGASAVAGGQVEVKVTLTIREGWHIYANPTENDAVKPTVVALAADAPATVVEVEYPVGTPMKQPESSEAVSVYSGETSITLRFQLSETLEPGRRVIPVTVRYQACNDRACLAPATLAIPLTIDARAR